MKIMVTSLKDPMHVGTLSALNPAADHHQPTGDSWTLMGKSGSVSVGSLLLSPGFCCVQGFACALQESVSPDLWKFYNQIPLASKVKFSGDSQSLCQISRLGNMLWVLELF